MRASEALPGCRAVATGARVIHLPDSRPVDPNTLLQRRFRELSTLCQTATRLLSEYRSGSAHRAVVSAEGVSGLLLDAQTLLEGLRRRLDLVRPNMERGQSDDLQRAAKLLDEPISFAHNHDPMTQLVFATEDRVQPRALLPRELPNEIERIFEAFGGSFKRELRDEVVRSAGYSQ